MNPTNANNLNQRQEMETAGTALAMTVLTVETRTPNDFRQRCSRGSTRCRQLLAE